MRHAHRHVSLCQRNAQSTKIKTCVSGRKLLRHHLSCIFQHQSPAGKKHTRDDPSQSCCCFCCCCWPQTEASTARLWGNSATPGTELRIQGCCLQNCFSHTRVGHISFQLIKNHSSTSPVHTCCVLHFLSVLELQLHQTM